MHQLSEDARILADPLEDDGQHSSEENVKTIVGIALNPCRSPCSTSNQSELMLSTGRTRSSHLMVELSDDCYHLRWDSDASEYLPQKGAVNGVVNLLEFNEAHEE